MEVNSDMIELRNVSKVYQSGTVALKNVNIKIEKGEFVFIVGPSGAGKSTIVRMLLKEDDPSSGEVFIGNYNLSELRQKDIPYLRRRIGVVFQDFRLLPDKTVYENVAFAMQIVEAAPKEIRRQVPTVLGLVGLSKKANSYPSELSGGEQQRTSLARAIVNNPLVLVADEPTGNLDPETSWEIMKLLNDINYRGTTVLVATHAKEIVDSMKKRVIAIENGIVIRDQEKGVYCYED